MLNGFGLFVVGIVMLVVTAVWLGQGESEEDRERYGDLAPLFRMPFAKLMQIELVGVLALALLFAGALLSGMGR